MLTIYAATNMPPFLIGAVRDLRAVWAAEELGLPYRLHWLDVRAGEQRADWYRALNPFAKVPALDDGGVHVFFAGQAADLDSGSMHGVTPAEVAGAR